MKINVLCNSKTIFSLFVYIYIYSQNNTEKVDPERYALLAKKKKKKFYMQSQRNCWNWIFYLWMMGNLVYLIKVIWMRDNV